VCEHCVSGKSCDHGAGKRAPSPCACSVAGPAKCPDCGCECASWDWGLGFVGPASIRSFFGVGDDENPGFSEYPASKSRLVGAARKELEDAEVNPADLDWLSRTLPEGNYQDRGAALAALCPVLSWASGDPSRLVAALPMNGIATGTRLVVARDQLAALVGTDGQPLDSFGPGEHVITRESAPRAAARSRPPAAGLPRSTISATPYFASSRESRIPVRRSGRTRSGGPVDIRLTATVSISSLSEFLARAGRHPQGISSADAATVVTSVIGPSLDQAIAAHTADELSGSSPAIEEGVRAGAAQGGLRVVAITIESAGAVAPMDQMAAMVEKQRQVMAQLPPEMQARIQTQMAQAMERAQAARGSRAGGAGTGVSNASPVAGRAPTPPGSSCPACQAANPPGTKFCGNCGQSLATKFACPRCGREAAPGLKFCGNCGSPFASPR